MKVAFEWYTPPEGPQKGTAQEYVRLSHFKTETQPADEVFREATDADRLRFHKQYKAFGGTQAPAPEPKAAPPQATAETKAETPVPPPDFMPGFVEGQGAADDSGEAHHEHSKKKHHR